MRELRVLLGASQGVYEGTVGQARSAQGQLGGSSSVTPSASETPPSFISRVTAGSGTGAGVGTGTGAGTGAGSGAGAERALLSHLRGRLSSAGAPPTLDELSCQLFERELELSEKQVRNCLRTHITHVYTRKLHLTYGQSGSLGYINLTCINPYGCTDVISYVQHRC